MATKKSEGAEPTKKRPPMVGMRAEPEELSIIDRAAKVEQRTRSSFVLHYSLRAAQSILSKRNELTS